MTFTKYRQTSQAKESEINDLYLLFAIFTVPLQEKAYIWKQRKRENARLYICRLVMCMSITAASPTFMNSTRQKSLE